MKLGEWVEVDHEMYRDKTETEHRWVKRYFQPPIPQKALFLGWRYIHDGKYEEHMRIIGESIHEPGEPEYYMEFESTKKHKVALVCLNSQRNPVYVSLPLVIVADIPW